MNYMMSGKTHLMAQTYLFIEIYQLYAEADYILDANNNKTEFIYYP
ncbi:hypothetical protein HELA111659_08570 [Helicobacter labetoulli]